MTAGQRKPEGQWTADERKTANLDQRLKSLIMSILPNDQMNSVINCLTSKSTWDDLILYHEGPSDVKESRVMDLKLCYNTFKFKEGETLTQTFTRYKDLMNELVNDGIKLSKLEIYTGLINGLPKKCKLKYEENLIDNIYETKKNKSLVSATPLSTAFISTSIIQDFQDSPDDEEDTRSNYEYLNDLEEKYQARALLAKSKRFFKKGTQRFNSAKATDQTECHKCGKKELRPTKDFEAKYNKVKAKLALLSSSALASKATTVKNKGLIAEVYKWDEEEVSSDDNEMVEVKVLMALAEENDVVSKEGARNGEWGRSAAHKINCVAYLEIKCDGNLMFIEEVQHIKVFVWRTLVKVLMALAEENDVVSKEGARNGEWVKISMRKVHTLLEMEDNDDRKTYLYYLCIDLNYVEEQRNNLLSKHRDLVHELNACKEQLLVLKQAKLDFLTMKHCISKQIPSQKKKILRVDQLTEDPSSYGQKGLVFVKSSVDDTKVSIPGVERPWLSKAEVAVTDSSTTKYDSADESLVCSTPLPPMKKLDGFEPISGSKTIKSILSSSASKVNSAPAGKLKSVKIEDDPPLAIVIKELNDLRLQISKYQSSYSRNNQQVPQNALQNKYKTQFKKSCDLCGINNHLSENCYKVLFCKKCERTDHRTCDHAEYISTMNMSQHLKILGRSSSRSHIPRPSKCFFSPCIHCGCIDHLSNECLYYLVCKLYGSYDHDTIGHNRIISLEREINRRNPQHPFKICEACGSSTHTTTDHYDIEWFKRGEALKPKWLRL
ncbi:hypothetical protein Tco_0352069 [Tanacetum coccineum]